ncbi:Hypothetical protein PHPALM_19238 [Phytophthora palmivora]|uniref:E3 ubiquitin-protein ligase n=1 Tax=Phytophthora palmivora TaxID=4796 RepID=A0A2P4XHS5_9STRA|nr:Hypothetical protein PHPALM_19238 [Phytophthora palmivora]
MAKTGETEHVVVACPTTEKADAPDVDMTLEARLTSLLNEPESEHEQQLVASFLAASRASQRRITRNLLLNPSIESFPKLLQFFLRVMMAAHADSHSQHTVKEQSSCSYTQNTLESCISCDETNVSFKLPESFHTCLATNYGSVKRLKCEEVWHGDHMAYRCRTCGLSDSSCMCLAYPLAWRPEGFCKKHSAQKDKTQRDEPIKMKMADEEDAVAACQ